MHAYLDNSGVLKMCGLCSTICKEVEVISVGEKYPLLTSKCLILCT